MKKGWTFQVLCLSLFLNVGLFALFFFFIMRENKMALPYKPVVHVEPLSIEALRQDPQLCQNFVQTTEFTLVRTLFQRAEGEVPSTTLFRLLLEGNQECLDRFVIRQQEGADFSASQRQQFLLDYLALGSKTAASLLVMLDLEYSLLLPNEEIEHILILLDEATPEAISFTEQVLEAKRSPAVHERALSRLTQYTGKSVEELAARYEQYGDNQNLRPLFRQQVPITQTTRTHIVQPGESLWLLARKYQVSMEKIMVMNNLRSTVLQPGQMLKIPFPEE